MRVRTVPLVSLLVCIILLLIAILAGLSGNPVVRVAVPAAIVCLICWQSLRVWLARRKIGRWSRAAAATLSAGRYSETIQLCDGALKLAGRVKLPAGDLIAIILGIRSQALQKLDRKDEALAAAAQAFACMCRVRRAGTQIAILDQLGNLLLDGGHERRAIPILEAVVALGQRAERQALRTSARLERVGLAYSRVGMHANSVAAFGKAVEILTREQGPDALVLSNPYINLGNGYKRMQKLDEAERCYRESLRLLEVNDAKTPHRLSLVLLNLGVACAESGRDEVAEQYYRQALDLRIVEFGRNDWRVGNTYNNLANCRRRMRDFEAAEEYLRKAMDILESRPGSMCHVIDTLARLREDQGRVEEALAETARARELQQSFKSPDLSQLATLFEREALLAGRTGDEDRASDCRGRANQLRQALAAAPSSDRDLTNMGDALRTLDQHWKSSLDYVKTLQEAV